MAVYPYIYEHQREQVAVLDENGNPVGSKVVIFRIGGYKNWWARGLNYHKVVTQEGYKDVHYHSNKPIMPLAYHLVAVRPGATIKTIQCQVIVDGRTVTNREGNVVLKSSNGTLSEEIPGLPLLPERYISFPQLKELRHGPNCHKPAGRRP
jgi:hypothetical protein